MNVFNHVKLALLYPCMFILMLLIVSPGKKELPDAKILAEKLLMRRQFIPDPQGTSLMFAFFAQHFTHQFFKSDMKKGPAFTLAKGHGVSWADFSLVGKKKKKKGTRFSVNELLNVLFIVRLTSATFMETTWRGSTSSGSSRTARWNIR